MSLDQIPKQNGTKIFLMNFDSKAPVKTGYFGKTPGFPVFLKRLLYEKPLLR